MFESFTEKLADGTFKAEPLSHVVSLFEEEQQDLKRPEPARQYNLQLDSRLTITTKRRRLSTEPTDEKGLRMKYAVLPTYGCLPKCGSQVGRSTKISIALPSRFFWTPYLTGIGSTFCKEVEGQQLIAPRWSFCLSYELELRKEASGCARKNRTVFRPTLKNTEHRMKHWLQLVAIPNSSSSSNQEM